MFLPLNLGLRVQPGYIIRWYRGHRPSLQEELDSVVVLAAQNISCVMQLYKH
jgi:hypothetical protein